ncbi:YihY/virulence factor BrkB family protein [Sphingobacterium corticibacterium]|uniref:YihY/virulence factor BrkB family protein n=1 Tax=Sphingobacterium corticibacterium TaxID=2484746 RepID=A0A4Q6XNR2_9SPHI|nr:YihY/virulence factor BrkB family protein [Sphingobacterium corticibacterium]RZF61285.1 YihY/virulence factor BrkB family protein [Sphingobacterium corticibacterium]
MEKETPWQKLKGFGQLLLDTINSFLNDKCLKKSASLAYYTVFSIGPLILILIWALGFFYGSQMDSPTGARDEIMTELNQLFGPDITNMLDNAIKKISLDSKNSIGLYIGIGVLVFSSTTIFVDIQNSINEIWHIKVKPKKGWLKIIIDRLLSFSMILGLGFLLMVSLILSSVIGLLMGKVGDFLSEYIPNINLQMINLINTGVSFLIIATLFACVFAFLPDAKTRFRDVLWGAIFTALLFLLGKSLISWYLSSNVTASSFGAAGSIIILLSFVYYSAAILYFGAEFTKHYAIKYGRGVRPRSYAVRVEVKELE